MPFMVCFSSRMCTICVVALSEQVEPANLATSATSIAFGIQNLLEIHAPTAFCVRTWENVYQPKRRKRLSKVHKIYSILSPFLKNYVSYLLQRMNLMFSTGLKKAHISCERLIFVMLSLLLLPLLLRHLLLLVKRCTSLSMCRTNNLYDTE